MAYGLVILTDLAIRSRHLREHYTDDGVLPLEAYFWVGADPYAVSLHALNGTPTYITILFVIHALAAVALFLGWRTKLTGVVCFILAVSLQTRNMAILNGGDSWMKLILLWAVFLPWGEKWSLDSRRPRSSASPERITTVATMGYTIQMISVYFVSVFFKTGPAWRSDGLAVYLSCHLTEWNSDLAYYLLFFPAVMSTLSWATLYFEMFGPFLWLSPVLFGPLRTLSILVFMSFHTGLAVFLELGVFPFVGLASLLGLFPSWAWRRRPFKWLGEQLDRFWKRCDRIAYGVDERYCWTAQSVKLELFLGTIILYGIFQNVSTCLKFVHIPEQLTKVSTVLGLRQNWALFAPEPTRKGGWVVLEGHLRDGSTVDLRTNQKVSWHEPWASSIYPSQRWKRWHVTLRDPGYKPFWSYSAHFLFKAWEEEHPAQAEDLVLVRCHWVYRDTLENFEDAPPQKHLYYQATREQYLQSISTEN